MALRLAAIGALGCLCCLMAPAGISSRPASAPADPRDDPPTRRSSRAEIDAVIDRAGSTQPDWWDSVRLNYPPTLDLAGTQQIKGWQPERALGAYFWSIVNTNRDKWREGIRLLHEAIAVRQNDRPRQAEAMGQLAECYRHYLNDWARAAYWYRKALAADWRPSVNAVVGLAESYWRLGSEPMAVEALSRYQMDRVGYPDSIKLWAQMGQTDRAIRLAEDLAASGQPDLGYLCAGNACRLAGRNKEALAYYRKALSAATGSRRVQQNHQRAQESIVAVQLSGALDIARVPDGTCSAGSPGFRGPVDVEVAVAGGRIASIRILRHKEDMYFYHLAVPEMPNRLAGRQDVKGVDAVTGATVTAEAVLNAATKALAEAMKAQAGR